MDVNKVVKLILDYRSNPTAGNFSREDNKETIRMALIEANGGSSKLDLKTLLRGRTDLYTIIETVVDRTVSEGLKGDEFFMNMVEERNLAYGDAPQFTADVNTALVVADAARGTQGIRRQRFGEKTSVTLTPTVKVIKVYEELSRLLAGTTDINDFIDAVTKAVKTRRLDDIYAAWNGVTSVTLGADYYPAAGSYDEDELIEVVNHVSAANDGAKCMLVCTLKGARKLATGIISNSAKEDYYKNGYALNWNGVNVQIVPQRHNVGGNTFIFDDDKIYVIPVGMDKPVKQVASGESLLIVGNPTDNADLSQEFTLITEWVTGVFTGKKFGIYELA